MALPCGLSGKVLVTSLKILVVVVIIVLGCWWAAKALKKNAKHSSDTTKNVTLPSALVSVYYETYCPDCVDFIVNQLYPVHATLREKVVIDFVPFGKAKQYRMNGELRFECQHGERECQGNMIHACAVRTACGERAAKDCPWEQRSRLMEFVFCNIQRSDRVRSTEECAQKAGLDASDILKCFGSPLGKELLSFYGNRTSNYDPPIGWLTGFVPSVAIDGEPISDTETVENLHGAICKRKPTLC